MRELDYAEYLYYVDHIAEKYGIGSYQEHRYIHEFFEAEECPLFKLIYGPTDKTGGKNVVVLTLHLDLNPVDSIQWYSRVSSIIPNVRLQQPYYKDDRGETFLGAQAETLKMYKEEQNIIAGWLESKSGDEEAKRYVESKVVGRVRNKKLAYVDLESAVNEFNRIFNPDSDEIQ